MPREELHISAGSGVVIIATRRDVLEVPWQKALELANAIQQQARVAESHARWDDPKQAEALIEDHKLMRGAGMNMNLGLPKRVAAGIGIKNKSVVGRPSLSPQE